MNSYARFGLLVLLFAATLVLASCGGSNTGSGADEPAVGNTQEEMAGEMTGMGAGSGEMTSGEMMSGEMASGMPMENGHYSNERFIDAMAPHHQSAVEMARIAQERAEHPEIRALAQDIIYTQEAEIEKLRSIKQEEFGTSEIPMEVGAEQMREMGMSNPGDLAGQRPFDRAFIDAMIPHHESAIAMSRVALRESDNPRIRELAGQIVESQQREVDQMAEWRKEWYPGG